MKKRNVILIIGIFIFFIIYLTFNNEKDINNKQVIDENVVQNDEKESHTSEEHFQSNQEIINYHDDHEHHNHIENKPEEKQFKKRQSINFTLKTLQGEKISLNELKGKKILLNFWTTWCPPCQEEMPLIEDYYKIFGKKHNMEVVAINISDQDSGIDVIKQFVDYYNLSFPIVLDEKGEISKKYEVLTIPTSFVVNESGYIEKEIIGPVTNEMLVDYFN